MAIQQQTTASILDNALQAGTVVLIAVFTLATAGVIVPSAHAQTYTVLHNFTGEADGYGPLAGVSIDRAGNLYGTAAYGGHTCPITGTCGTVYKLQPRASGWVFSTLYEFNGPDGASPEARVIIGPDGNLYGTTAYGGDTGNGTVFRLQPPATFCRAISCPWTETVLHSFAGGADGAYPEYGDLTFDQAGNVYGTTPYGGSGGCGTVYELSPSGSTWTYTLIYSFGCGTDGYEPFAGVIFDSAGNLYGNASGGTGGNGNAFKLTHGASGWTATNIYNYPFPGGAYGGFAMDSSGNLYGISTFNPTVYELSPSNGGWSYQQLYNVGGYDANAQPTLDSEGNIYGTVVLSNMVVFRLTLFDQHWMLSGFNNAPGEESYSNVVFNAGRNAYLTTSQGGTNGLGIVFEITP